MILATPPAPTLDEFAVLPLVELGSGMFLGPALWLGPPRRPGATLLLWFALTTQRQ